MKTISIVTICYNAENTITVTMNSVLHQSYQDYEYIIIDGASKDKTLEKINCLNNGRAQVYSEPDRGISDAFNKGIQQSTGEYILFLNSGDYFLNADCLGQVADILEHNANEIVTFSVESIYCRKYPENETEGQKLWTTSMVPHQGTFVKKTVFDKVGNFNECFKIRMDYDFFSRCYRAKCSFQCVPWKIVYYDADGISSNNHYLFNKEGLAVRLLNYEDISEDDINLIQELSNKNGSDRNHYRVQLEKDICCNDDIKRNEFWKYNRYVIYGAGTAGLRLYHILKSKINNSRVMVCDSNKSGSFMKEFDQEIKSLRDIVVQYCQDPIIISIQNKLALCEVYSSLIEIGIEKKKIYIYDEENVEIY